MRDLHPEMLCKIDKCVIFIPACADDTDDRLSVVVRQSEVGSVAASARNLTDVGGLSTFPLRIEFNEFLHNDCKITKKK